MPTGLLLNFSGDVEPYRVDDSFEGKHCGFSFAVRSRC